MWTTYRAILAHIERDPLVVLRRRVRLSRLEKLWLASRVSSCVRERMADTIERFATGRRSSAAAWPDWRRRRRLSQRGFHVELFEARRKLGGRAGSYVDRADRRIDRSLPARGDGLLHEFSRFLPADGQ